MLKIRIFFTGLILILACQIIVSGQTRIDSLRYLIERQSAIDSSYSRTCLEICKVAANTEDDFLIPEYAIRGLNTGALSEETDIKFHLYEYLGNYYFEAGELTNAAEQYNQMLLIGEMKNDTIIISNSYRDLGGIFLKLGDNDKALEYYRKGLAFAGTDTLLKGRFYNDIANAFLMMGIMDSVFPNYQKSVEYHKSHQDFPYLAKVYSNIAQFYSNKNMEEETRKYIELAFGAAEQSNDPYQISSAYMSLALMVFSRHPDIAHEYFLQSLKLARECKSYDLIRTLLDKLALLEENRGNYKKSGEYLRELKTLEDSIELSQQKARLRQNEFEYQAELSRAKEAEDLRTEDLDKLTRIHRERTLLYSLAAGVIVLLVLLIFAYRTHMLRKKISQTRERFFSMIAHDIRSPFSGILGLSEILKEGAQHHPDPSHLKQADSLNKSLTHVYDLLDNLLQWSLSETGKIAFNPHFQLVTPIVDEVISIHQASAKQKGVTIKNDVQFGLSARFDSNMFQTILRNLVSNAIKFSPVNSSISITAKTQGKEALLSVRDQGVGMDAQQIEKIFKSDERVSTRGTNNEKGTGIGLILCKNFVTQHGGKIKVESKVGDGTTISFTLPD